MYLKQQPAQYEEGGQYVIIDKAVVLLARDNFAGSYLPSDFLASAIVRKVREEPFGNFSVRTAMVAGKKVSAVNRYYHVSQEIYSLGIPVPRQLTDSYEQGNDEPLRNWVRANIDLLEEPVVIGRRRREDRTSPVSPVYLRQYPDTVKEICDTCRQEHPTYRNIDLHTGILADNKQCWWCGANANSLGRVVERYSLKEIFRYCGDGISYCDAHLLLNMGEPADYQPHSATSCQACDALQDWQAQNVTVLGTWPGGSKPIGRVQ